MNVGNDVWQILDQQQQQILKNIEKTWQFDAIAGIVDIIQM